MGAPRFGRYKCQHATRMLLIIQLTQAGLFVLLPFQQKVD